MQNISEMTSDKRNFGDDKTATFRWKTVDSPGEFKMINKHLLWVNYDYQKDTIANNTVMQITSNWSWVACGVICVEDNGDGTYTVIDGQHRTYSAARRSDIIDLPCLVFKLGSLQKEALGFLNSNVVRRPATAYQQLKAKTIIGDRAAMLTVELMKQYGYSYAKATRSGKTLNCIGAMIRCADTAEGKFLRQVFPVLVSVCAGQPITDRLLLGFHYLQSHGYAINDGKQKKLISIGREGLLSACNKAAALYTRGGERVWAEAIKFAIEQKSRKSKMPQHSLEV